MNNFTIEKSRVSFLGIISIYNQGSAVPNYSFNNKTLISLNNLTCRNV